MQQWRLAAADFSACSTSSSPSSSSAMPATSTSSASCRRHHARHVERAQGRRHQDRLPAQGLALTGPGRPKQGAEQAGKEFNYKIEFVDPDSETQVTQQNRSAEDRPGFQAGRHRLAAQGVVVDPRSDQALPTSRWSPSTPVFSVTATS